MNDARPSSTPSRLDLELQKYYDGELSGLAQWRFERRLRRSPALRSRLDALGSLGALLREHYAEEPSPELWDQIAMRLPAVDAGRVDAPVSRSRGPRWILWPGAALTSLALAAVVASRWVAPEPPASGPVVRWLDSGDRDVIVLEGSSDTTIIWVFGGGAEAAIGGGRRDVV